MSAITRHTNAIARLTSFTPDGIARDLVTACNDIRGEPPYCTTNAMCADPAVRLLAYRLAVICNIRVPDVGEYDRLVSSCQEQTDRVARARARAS